MSPLKFDLEDEVVCTLEESPYYKQKGVIVERFAYTDTDNEYFVDFGYVCAVWCAETFLTAAE